MVEGRCSFEYSVIDYPASMLAPAPIPREPKMIRKDDQLDHAENLTRQELCQRELEREEAEEKAFAELVRSPEGQCIMHPRR